MGVRRQDVAVTLCYLLGFSRLKQLVSRLRRDMLTRFITFHDTPPEALPVFAANLEFLKHHTNVVSFDDFMAGRLSDSLLNIVLTFDDGYRSWVTGALPILNRLKLPATFFICSGFVGIDRPAQLEFMRQRLHLSPTSSELVSGLTPVDIRRLADAGFTIGGHSVSHAKLPALTSEEHVMREIAEDRMRLQSMAGCSIDYFAYPFGACLHPHIDLARFVREAGYRAAVTTSSGANTATTDRFLLHRELALAEMPQWVFRARATGNYDAVQRLKALLS
ncbi:MAG: polysaccharide deacetylase family protein [Burkholderiales bacterium]